MRRLLAAFFATLAVALAAACGARSSLPIESFPSTGGAGGAGGTGGVRGTGGTGGTGGVPILVDAGPDAPPDAPPANDCAEAGVTFIYIITAQNTLYSFYPPSAAYTPIGTIFCPGETLEDSPFSMGVDRQGIAWVVFQQTGKLFRVDTANAGCTATPYLPDQLGWITYGMAFATTPNGPGDTLFVAESTYQHPSLGLGTIDLQSFQLQEIAPLALPSDSFAVELTGTGDGRLFGFSLDQPGPGSHVSQIDEVSGAVLDTAAIPLVGNADSSFAFAYWGGSFYLFTANAGNNPTTVNRYDPATGTVEPVPGLADSVVGVGVSTCAPE